MAENKFFGHLMTVINENDEGKLECESSEILSELNFAFNKPSKNPGKVCGNNSNNIVVTILNRKRKQLLCSIFPWYNTH